MSSISVNSIKNLCGQIIMPGDKSISHRAVIIASIASGITRVSHFLESEDCRRTIKAFQAMGIKIKKDEAKKEEIIIEGRGLYGLTKPKADLYMGNSGTSMRLILGILAGQGFEARLTGDSSLSKRPMKRVSEPLRLMGAKIYSTPSKILKKEEDCAPLTIQGGKLKGINYRLPIPSAQVKSAILLAALYAQGTTKITEPVKSRDHTERMFKLFGAKLKEEKLKVSISAGQNLTARKLIVPGDISSAAFFLVAGALVNNATITIKDVGLNPTRTGIIDILKEMKANLEISNFKKDDFEPRGDITVTRSNLKSIIVKQAMIPRLIDELPVIMVAATQAEGTTIIENASELRVKETDRINSMLVNLQKMGADIEVEKDTVIIRGPCHLQGALVDSFGDHRTAMSLIVAGMAATGTTKVRDTACIDTSFPSFKTTLKRLI